MERRDAKTTPGPGNNTIASKISEGPKWGMGQKLESSLGKTMNVPGPGNYEL